MIKKTFEPKTTKGWLAYLNWQFYKGYQKIVIVESLKISDEWEKFPNTKDEWKRNKTVEDETNGTCFTYKPEIGSKFPAHVHPFHTEIVFMWQGTAKVVTPFWTVVLRPGDSLKIDKEIPHIFVFDKVQQCLFDVFYPEGMPEGWSGSFFEK